MTLQTIQDIISEYFKTQPILKAWIFGSYARGEENPLSDIDILVQYEEEGVSLLKHTAILYDLENMLNHSVDLVQEKLLKPNIMKKVNVDKKLIYERPC